MTGYVLHNFTPPDLNPFFIHKFATKDGVAATWLSVQIEVTSNGMCEPMSVLARNASEGAPPASWGSIAEGVLIQSSEFPLAALPAGIKAIEVKLELPYQSGDCKFTVQGVTATWKAQ